MRAIVQHTPGGALELANIEIPTPGFRQILIRVNCTSLNRMDLLQAKGSYPVPSGASPILGVEVAGTVAAVDSTCTLGFQISETICALLLGGGYAEFAVVDERTVIRGSIFPTLSMKTIASIPEAFMTAYQLMYFVANLQPGETLLLHAGASSIGQAAIQMAIRKGVKVFVTSRTDGKCARCIELGATGAITVGAEGKFSDAIRALNDGKGIDVILDPVGSAYTQENLSLVAVDGRIVIYGLMSGGAVDDPAFLGKLIGKRASIMSSTLRARNVEYKERLIQALNDDPAAFPAIASGDISVDVSATYNLEEVREAHKYMTENKNTGKIVMLVSTPASAAEELAKELDAVAKRNGLP